jgi:hypothetical protein
MKNKLTLTEMTTFVEYVVKNTLLHGEAFRQAFINYCICVFYGEKKWQINKIADLIKLYDDGLLNPCFTRPDQEQLTTIINAIDKEIDTAIKYMAAEKVMSQADKAISELSNKISNIIDKQSTILGDKYISSDDIKKVINVVSEIQGNLTADKLTKALVDNGVIGQKAKKDDITFVSVNKESESIGG